MHKFAEGLAGIKVVTDDFLVIGFRDSYSRICWYFWNIAKSLMFTSIWRRWSWGRMKSSLLDTWHQLKDSELTLIKSVPSQRCRDLRSSITAWSCMVPSEVSAQHHQAFARYHTKWCVFHLGGCSEWSLQEAERSCYRYFSTLLVQPHWGGNITVWCISDKPGFTCTHTCRTKIHSYWERASVNCVCLW